MTSIALSLIGHHQHCDQLFEVALKAIATADWDMSAHQFRIACEALQLHMAFEEQELFPAYEETSGANEVLTSMMCAEHAHIRDLLSTLALASPRIDPQGYATELERLRALLREHNLKEEALLYPACERLLGTRTDLQAGARWLNEITRTLAQRSP